MSAASLHLSEREHDLWRLLEGIADPEIPVLSIVDLGIVRYVRAPKHGSVRIGLTPTYSGCPATDHIRSAVRDTLDRNGFTRAVIEEALSPPWSSEWLSEEGRRKLESFGIAPPVRPVSNPKHLLHTPRVRCPRCRSESAERLSEFGSTPCKAHYRCLACREPFDYFKCI